MGDELRLRIKDWIFWDKNEVTKAEILKLIDNEETEVLRHLLLHRLHFGTAGLRGRMGAGFSRMNDLVVIQTSQGIAAFLLKEYTSAAVGRGVVVGYDGRHHSKRFAELTAAVFVRARIPVYLYSTTCPTPFVSFVMSCYRCICGVMITASHNPKEDNGYKVFGHNGAQIISPYDQYIEASIHSQLVPSDDAWDTSILQESELVYDPVENIERAYYEKISADSLFVDLNSNTRIKFTYSAMHGVGYPYMVKAFEAAKFKPLIAVEEQRDPDPEFPTVKYPNPEEGRSALALSFRTAHAHGSSLILANDPDADRLAIAEKTENGEWHVFSGNEIGALLGWWSLFCYRVKFPNATLENVYMLSSTVSSKILRSMASVEGFAFMETLTGFKWMGNIAHDMLQQGKTVLFAFEEAIGFMFGTAVLDKDGISAGVHIAQLAAYLAAHNVSLKRKLEDIYRMYGLHISENSYFLCYDPVTIERMFNRLRFFHGAPNTYPQSLLNGKYPVVAVRDLTTGYDSSQPDFRARLPVSSSSQMITFTFSNGLVATLRTSGTEPKVKYYTELCCPPGDKNAGAYREVLVEMVHAIIHEFLQPEINALISPS